MPIIMKRLGSCLLMLALLAAGCSQPASDSEDAEPDSTEAAEPADSSSGVDDDETDGPPALAPAGPETPGVTDDTITVSFIITDTSAVAAAFGWEVPTEGDREAQVAALVDDINARGGIAGRTIDAKVHVFNAMTDGPVAEEALCNAITQDDRAFAVVMTGQFQENARPCYANAKTLMLDATLYPVDNAGFDELAPYLWSPFLPSYDNLTAGMASSLTDSGWFASGTVGVISIDSDLSQRAYEQEFAPVLDAAGVEVASFNTIDPTDGRAFENDLLQAIVNFKEANVDRVVAIGGSRLISWFINTAITQNFEPQYAVSSYDSPDFNIFNYGPQMVGATGISVLPGADVADDQWPFPANDAEAACINVFSDAGLAIDDRAMVRTGLMFCDAVQLLAAAGDGAAEVSAAGFGDAMWALGAGFEAASVYSVQFVPGQYAGGGSFMPFAFDAGCECMVVGGSPIDFDG
jgi:ABC-type branched-subunit amino acid transport system substrate-binding protein